MAPVNLRRRPEEDHISRVSFSVQSSMLKTWIGELQRCTRRMDSSFFFWGGVSFVSHVHLGEHGSTPQPQAHPWDTHLAVPRGLGFAREASWAIQWMNRESSFAERLVAFACVEGARGRGRGGGAVGLRAQQDALNRKG